MLSKYDSQHSTMPEYCRILQRLHPQQEQWPNKCQTDTHRPKWPPLCSFVLHFDSTCYITSFFPMTVYHVTFSKTRFSTKTIPC